MKIKTKRRKPSRLGKEKIRSLKRARREKLRIVSKIVAYKANGENLWFTGDEDRGGITKPNLPGGGRNKRERLWRTAQRETSEETSLRMTNSEAQNAIVLRRGKVTTSREGYSHKYLVLSALLCEDLESVTASAEIANPRIFKTPADAIVWLQSDEVILDPTVRTFYISAMRKLQKLIG